MNAPQPDKRLGAILFFVAAGLFFASAVIGGQPTFYALGAVFLVLGASTLARGKRP